MKLAADDQGNIIITEVFSGLGFITEDGEHLSICMRDSGYEINYMGTWYEFKEGEVIESGKDEVAQKGLTMTTTEQLKISAAAYIAALEYDCCPSNEEAACVFDDHYIPEGLERRHFYLAPDGHEGRSPSEIIDTIILMIARMGTDDEINQEE